MSLRSILSTGALVLASGYLLFSFLGPDGLPMVMQKRRQIQELRQRNAEIERENAARRAQIERFARVPEERERKTRQELNLLKKNETRFVFQEQERQR